MSRKKTILTLAPELEGFLRKSKVITKFKRAAKSYLTRCGLDIHHANCVSCAFVWNLSEEGQGFWRDIDTKWIKYRYDN